MKKGVKNLLHYLDDFIFVSETSEEASTNKQILVDVFSHLGVPLEPDKLEGPATCLTFLGIEVDTITLQIRLPRDKLDRLKEQLGAAVSKRCLAKRDLQSLTGLLQHTTKVVRPGRPFLHRLYALQNVGSRPTHFIRLNQAARADITWWFLFVERWNGLSIAWDLKQRSLDFTVFSDASGLWGCGAYSASHWFQLEWPPQVTELPIATKELFLVVIAAALFGKLWSGHLVEFKVDNLAIVQVIQATYCKDPHLMHLIRLLVFFAAMPRLRQVLKGIQIEHSKRGRVPHFCLPITPAILRKLRLVWIKDCKKIPFNNIMLWAACLVTFFSFCRSGEITVDHEDRYD